MLNPAQLSQFRNAVSSWHCNGSTDPEDLATAEIVSRDEDVAITRGTIEEFFAARGRRLDRHGNIPAVPRELETTPFGDLYVWRDQQSRKGCRRGTLWVMPFGEFCAAYFDGEV